MPELPEVETIVQDLKTKISGHKILGVDSDWPKIVKEPDYKKFKREIRGLIIENIERKGKNIVIYLSQNKVLLIHLKMTGHPLVSTCWEFTNAKLKKKNLEECQELDAIDKDPQNRFIHIGFSLDKGKSLLLSDLRKFASIKLTDKEKLSEILKDLGPDAMDNDLNFETFKRILQKEKKEIKKILMDQTKIAGIGNIYSDEILFDAKINPEKRINLLTPSEIKIIYHSMKKILKEAIKRRGTSISDFRDTAGEKGFYGDIRKVYRRTDEPCPKKCGGTIKRVTIGGRSAHFCPKCQQLDSLTKQIGNIKK